MASKPDQASMRPSKGKDEDVRDLEKVCLHVQYRLGNFLIRDVITLGRARRTISAKLRG